MKKLIVIPDSFKGTLSSMEICAILKERILHYYPDAEVITIPVADGGEGSVDCLLTACGGKKIPCRVKGPYFEDTDAFYGLLPDGTAVVEMAVCAGLPLVADRPSAADTTTFGVGELIAQAISDGARRVVLCLGGSATNDGGAGMAAALGVRFYGKNGAFIPVGRTLREIERIDASGVSEVLSKTEIVAMCDIDNPLCGKEGAAFVFAPQKGATEEEILLLDEGLSHLADLSLRDLARDIRNLPGAGAAGGMGGGAVAFLGARLQAGIETVLETVGFDSLLKGTDLVLTGEGKIDEQSLRGKVVIGVARHAKRAGVPVAAIVGDIGDGVERAYEEGVTGIFSINRVAVPFCEAKLRSKNDLFLTADNLLRYHREVLKK